MKLFLIIGIFLGSALTASALVTGELPPQCRDGNWAPICAIIATGGGSTGSGNNTGNGTNPCLPSSKPSSAGAQSGWATTGQINKELADGTLKPEDIARRAWGSAPTTNSNPTPATTVSPIRNVVNTISSLFNSFRRDDDLLARIQKANDIACKGPGGNYNNPEACNCKAPNTYSKTYGCRTINY